MNGKKRISILTASHLCRNPRVVKEATALGAAGYDVTVLSVSTQAEFERLDLDLVRELPFQRKVVDFTGRMVAIDKGKLFQKATFEDNIEVVSVPSDSPGLEVERHRLPPRSVFLKCKKELVVWSHKKGDGPAAQRMDATGAAYLRSDDYEGWAETISNDGKLVRLSVPPLSEERRKQLVTQIKKMAEQGRVAIRNIRRDQNKHVESLGKDGDFTEDQTKKLLDAIQDETKKAEGKIDAMVEKKSKEIMEV